MDIKDVLLCFAFFFELYHSIAHLSVLTGFRMLPRKDLVRAKQYFIIDAACAATAYALHQAPNFYFFLILQQWQHIFYYSTWDQSAAAKRVISWSSLDWDRGRWNQLDLVMGTAYDLGIHLANTYFLGNMISIPSQFIGTICCFILYYVVIYDSKFAVFGRKGAWSSRSNVPDWVSKRIEPLTKEQVQEVPWMDKLIRN